MSFAPLTALSYAHLGAEPEPGAQPEIIDPFTARQSHRRTSSGEAEAKSFLAK